MFSAEERPTQNRTEKFGLVFLFCFVFFQWAQQMQQFEREVIKAQQEREKDRLRAEKCERDLTNAARQLQEKAAEVKAKKQFF